MRIFWTENALRDRSAIRIFVAMDNPDAATRMDRLFSDAVARLANFPTLGRAGDVVGTRELTPHVNYRLV